MGQGSNFKEEFQSEVDNLKSIFTKVTQDSLLGTIRIISNFSYGKVVLNIVLTFMIPLVLFSIPISENEANSFFENFVEKLKTGILFSTSISILATIISSYIDNAKVYKTNEEDNKDNLKVKKMDKLMPTLLIAFLLTILSAYFFGQVNNSETINRWGILLQIIIFVLVQIVYGVSIYQINNSGVHNLIEDSKSYEEEQEEEVKELANNIYKNDKSEKYSKMT